MLVKIFVAVVNDWKLSDLFRWYSNRKENKAFVWYLIYTWCILAFCMYSFTFFYCITSTSVAVVQLQKYSFLNCKEPVEDPWSSLQPPGTLGEKTSCQNSQHWQQGNVRQPCLCVFTAEFEHALLAGLLCELFFTRVDPRLFGQQSRNLNCFRAINISYSVVTSLRLNLFCGKIIIFFCC